jgi:hypothetical protein
MTKTFLGLLQQADLSGKPTTPQVEQNQKSDSNSDNEEVPKNTTWKNGVAGLHYNIQIHLPATKDVEVYNAIFKSLREHLLNE